MAKLVKISHDRALRVRAFPIHNKGIPPCCDDDKSHPSKGDSSVDSSCCCCCSHNAISCLNCCDSKVGDDDDDDTDPSRCDCSSFLIGMGVSWSDLLVSESCAFLTAILLFDATGGIVGVGPVFGWWLS